MNTNKLLFLELICIYWPFYGYTTRSYGFMMSAVGHTISAIMVITAVMIWEAGYWKQFDFIQSFPYHQGNGVDFCTMFYS